jgi:pumilio RNA-binding family
MVMDHLVDGLLDLASNEQAFKSITKALKEGGTEMHTRIVTRMSEPARTARRAMIVDLALTSSGSQLISAVLPNVRLSI